MTSTHKFRFGVAASGVPSNAAAWHDLARKAEDLGYSTLLVSDHMGQQVSPLIAAAAALTATTTLRVGTNVLANAFRNPAVLAKEIATLDVLSDGRFEPGLGAGWPSTSPIGRSDSQQTGIDMGPNAERVARLAETVQIIKRFLTSDEPFDFDGKHHKLTGVIPAPRAAQRPRPPIMVAGAGPKMLQLAAREADIINIAPRPPVIGPTARGNVGFGLTIADEVALIKAAAGDRYADLELCVLSNNPSANNPSITDDAASSIEALAREIGTTPEHTRAMPHTLIGNIETLVERIHHDRAEYDLTYRIIPASAIDRFAPIVAGLAGT